MKRIIALIMTALLVFSLCACGKSAEPAQPSIEDRYYDFAKECLDGGDTDKAIAALEEGIGQTGSEKLQGLLDEINAQIAEESKKAEEEAKAKEEQAAKEQAEKEQQEKEAQAAEEQKKKADQVAAEQKKKAEQEAYYQSLCGTYRQCEDVFFADDLWLALYVKDGNLKLHCEYARLAGGYFPVTDNGDGTFTAGPVGDAIYTENGQIVDINLCRDVLCYLQYLDTFDEIGSFDELILTPADDGLTVNFSFRRGGAEFKNVDFYNAFPYGAGYYFDEMHYAPQE